MTCKKDVVALPSRKSSHFSTVTVSYYDGNEFACQRMRWMLQTRDCHTLAVKVRHSMDVVRD